MKTGILLYGPPASGKDTVTAALTAVDVRIRQFRRLKVGSGRTEGYRLGTAEELRELEAAGEVLYRNERYGNVYLVDRPGLDAVLDKGYIPVVHLGQVAGVLAVRDAYPARWLTVRLDCPRDVTAARSVARGDRDTEARLRAWDATAADLEGHDPKLWDVHLPTDRYGPAEAAERVRAALGALEGSALR
ncbi:guanylate kinase [Streptomyces sp. NPDC058459]|uniref:phosphotransferase-like protein n=1 Tax=Streptomyces sp. NPDC058459 TaxID=3346508 RepID=UPI00364A2842